MILIIEDNIDVNHMLAEALSDVGYETKSVYSGIDGSKELKQQDYELVLLDLMLPYKSGDQILKELRSYSNVPVIVISAKDMVGIKIDLLKLGADDYITKPFDLDEVVARVEANLRRTKVIEEKTKTYQHRNLILEEQTKRITVYGQEIDFTSKEYSIVEAMVKNKNKVFTKANLYEMIWGEEYFGDDNTVKTHLSNLRTKLKKADPEEEYIETVWGLGYRLTKDTNIS